MHALSLRPSRDLPRFLEVVSSGWGVTPANTSWLPRVDVFESNDTLTARFELAGFAREDLDVTLQDNLLTVKGTRKLESPEGADFYRRELAHGSFTRSLRVSKQFDEKSIRATFTNGLLEVTIGKRPEVLPRNVEIEAA